jgi:hypothetical protein
LAAGRGRCYPRCTIASLRSVGPAQAHRPPERLAIMTFTADYELADAYDLYGAA